MFTIGPYSINNSALLAPMAGISDRPFRQLCRDFGAALAISEMVSADARLWDSTKSRQRMDIADEPGLRSVQIAGYDPHMMANAARHNVAQGAHIIDINMGCPAKKVCSKAAGSALLRDEPLVTSILQEVVAAVDVPVTLKIRTGWCENSRNALEIARIAEQSGIQALTIHGRTRECRFRGEAEYDTIKQVKQAVGIPVIANGDINSPRKAQFVLDSTGADAIMVGRAAQGRPWIFREIQTFLDTGTSSSNMTIKAMHALVIRHITDLHRFYGEFTGIRIARKHVGWYSSQLLDGEVLKRSFSRLETAHEQFDVLNRFFAKLDGDLPLAA